MPAAWQSKAVMQALVDELNDALSGARVQKVHQASSTAVVLDVHNRGVTRPLLLDAAAGCLVVTAHPPRRETPEPPGFQGLLRKHLVPARFAGARFEAEASRVVLTFETRGAPLSMVLEWPRNGANVLLIHDNGTLMGAVNPMALRDRGLSIGKPYNRTIGAVADDGDLPQIDAEALRSHPHADLPTHAAVDLLRAHAAEKKEPPASPWRRTLKALLDRTSRLVAALEADLNRAEEADGLRMAAERAKVAQDKLLRGSHEWELRDPWQPDAPIVRVKVDPALSVQNNVEKLFHRARRLDRTRQMARPKIAEARAKADAIKMLIARLDAAPADEALAEEARRMLGQRAGRAAPEKRKGPQTRQPFRAFTTDNGLRVLVGKTSKDNDALTHRVARGSDIFLHARDAHGAHVILVVEKATPGAVDAAIGQAAQLAAHFSEAREQGVVDVRWTEVKHVRRVPGRQGMVTLAKERVRRVRIGDDAFKRVVATEEGASTRA